MQAAKGFILQQVFFREPPENIKNWIKTHYIKNMVITFTDGTVKKVNIESSVLNEDIIAEAIS